MTLAELQQDFQSWLASAAPDAAHRLSIGSSSIGSSGSGAHAPGLSVYQNNYRGQLVASLEAAFPQVRAWMGSEAFHYAAVTHIDRHPPHAWTLDAYADNFGATLLELFPHNPDIHELAWIESALSAAFVAADAKPLQPAQLEAIDWDSAWLHLSPSLQTNVATANAEALWWAMSESGERPEGEMLAEARGLMVWRRDMVSCLRSIDLLELDALRQLQADGSFNALCAMLVERLGEEQGIAKAGAFLASWIGSELLTGASSAPNSNE
jgi:hypothetical protein